MKLLIPEVFRVLVRLNPVNLQIYQFNETIQTIQKGLERNQVYAIVESAIGNADLGNAVESLRGYDNVFHGLANTFFSEMASDLAATIPNYRAYIPNLPDGDSLGAHASARVLDALHSNRQSLEVLAAHFWQLIEYLPRYRSIMTRTGVFDFVLGFAAGFLGGDIGQVGAQLWDGWRGQDDAHFIESFTFAVEQFSNSGVQFTQQIEANIEPVLGQLVFDFEECNSIILRGLEHYAMDGGYLARVCLSC